MDQGHLKTITTCEGGQFSVSSLARSMMPRYLVKYYSEYLSFLDELALKSSGC